jgi:hypothetical protein
MNGKGSKPRPLSCTRFEFGERWDDTFCAQQTITINDREPVILVNARGDEMSVRRRIGFTVKDRR